MLGHLRHETWHYYWPVLIERAGRLAAFRDLFGDEGAASPCAQPGDTGFPRPTAAHVPGKTPA
jgi:hypothetical protein